MQWNLKQLEAFVWVAKLGSFRRTAERLNTTQPNISVRISSLENVLGVKLFERDAGSVRLTPAGTGMLDAAERVLAATDEFSVLSGHAADQIGVIRLGVTGVIAQTWLRGFLVALKAEFPNLAVELTVDISVNLRRELMDRALDLALLNGPIADFNIDNIDLGAAPLVWVAAPGLVAAPITLETMAKHAILTPTRNTRPYVEVAAHFRAHWQGPVRIVPSSSLIASMQMAVDAMGIAPLPFPLVQEHLASGTLVQLCYAWVPSPLVVTASFHHTPASRVVRRAAEISAEVATRGNNVSLSNG